MKEAMILCFHSHKQVKRGSLNHNLFEKTITKWSLQNALIFGRPFVKRSALCHPTVVCLCSLSCPVCDVRALWPNGWTDQDETWQAGRPRPWPHCVRWGTSFPPKGHSPTQFSAHICCGQMAAWIKMPLGMEVGLSPGDFVLDGDQAP